ncbi:hypothetical protein [Neorhizobium alkalisoli]|nr:hypothetical protein [Neorhizobium alkalisoli]
MSRAAAIMMFLAWLLYGAMPAVGMPMMQPVEETAQVSMPAHAHHEMGKLTQTAEKTHSHGKSQQNCPHGGKICVTPFCAACLTLLPDITFASQRLAQPYPIPAPARSLLSAVPAPLTPPPRA